MKKEPLCRPNGMTREEAKSMFEDIRHYRYMESDVDVKTYDNLLDMAISALSAEVKRNCKECYHSTNGCMAGTETCHLCMYENQFEPKPSTEGEYIKKSELLQHVTTEELSDFKDCDVIHAEEIDELTTYSFPDSAENKGEWIPVSERLPEDHQNILFSTKTDRVFEGRYFKDETEQQWYSFRDECFAWNNVVTAWQPLPEPYKAESEGAE